PTPGGTVQVSSTPTGQVTVAVVPEIAGAEQVGIGVAAAGGTGPTAAGTIVASDNTKTLVPPNAANFLTCPPPAHPQLGPKTLRTVCSDPNRDNDHSHNGHLSTIRASWRGPPLN